MEEVWMPGINKWTKKGWKRATIVTLILFVIILISTSWMAGILFLLALYFAYKWLTFPEVKKKKSKG